MLSYGELRTRSHAFGPPLGFPSRVSPLGQDMQAEQAEQAAWHGQGTESLPRMGSFLLLPGRGEGKQARRALYTEAAFPPTWRGVQPGSEQRSWCAGTPQKDLPGWTGQGETKRRPAKSHRTQADKEQMSFHGSAVPTGATRIPSMQTRPLTLSQQAMQETSLGLLCPHKERVAQPHQSPAQCRGWAAQTT